MTARSAEKDTALAWIEANRPRLSDFDLEIWRYAEPAWREYRSARAYVDLLRAEGLDVEEGSGGMPTAFCATWGDGGPVLGAYAEYDAVPGNSQQAVPYRAPRAGLHPWAAGHTDPHSMLGTTALAGVLGAKAAMERHGLKGTLRFFGEPAEKVCGSKPVHAAKGYYDGVDAFIAYHPHATNSAAWETQCGSYWSAVFTFECEHPETWIDPSLMPYTATSHATARCPGAIDALCLMYTNTKYIKEAMFPHTGTWTLNEFVLAAGDATSDNLPPRFSQIQYSWRSPELGIQAQIAGVLENNARHAAAVTGCTVSVRWVTKTRVGLTNNALADLTYRNLQLVGPPQFGERAREFGRAIQRNLGLTPMDNPFADGNERLTTPQEYEAGLRRALPEWQRNFTSDDYVEYTWHAPTVRLLTARPALRAPHAGYQYPAWARNALGGVAEAIDPGLFVGGKTIAATLVDLLTQPDELARTQDEFKERTGGGVGGDKWVAPLLPRDFPAPIELRWPEYVTTVRGEGWWIPAPNPGAMQTL
ncbi:MAG TPA: M20/M25/M40 family metallo-hydrolase [Thermomicrobiales bacterium]|nr:M20/M25/M40 family metallo-hydrolase [Thermomicrobiales bacterium]